MSCKIAVCPVCSGPMKQPLRDNALSRFALDKPICSRCGEKEAIQGFFWVAKARRYRMRLKDHHVAAYGFGGPRNERVNSGD
jgi:hypothetical protein